MRGVELVDVLLSSIAAARHFSTWLCLHVYLPWERLTLQMVRMCLRVAGMSKEDMMDLLLTTAGVILVTEEHHM